MWFTYVAWSVTHYWVESLWLKPQWGQDCPYPSTPTPRPTQCPVEWVPRLFPRAWH